MVSPTNNNPDSPSASRQASWRGALLCVAIYLACLLIAWPVAEMGFVDDWSYIKTAQVFAQTGHFTYNGWATAMLGWQIPWAALFIKLFGFSFTVVKLSTVPVAVAVAVLFHAILARFGINSRNAVIGTLTLVLSPFFMSLSVSYMTDIPGIFVIVLCLYCCKRALDAEPGFSTIAWLCLAAASNVIGGTARQITWLGVLVMVPCAGWLMRKRCYMLPVVGLLWVVSVFCIYSCMHWFSGQPYAISESVLPDLQPFSSIAWLMPLITVDRSVAAVLCLGLAIFPVLVAWFPKPGKRMYSSLFLAALVVLPTALVQVLVGPSMKLWLQYVLFKELSMNKYPGEGWVPDAQSSILPFPAQIAISLAVAMAVLHCLGAVRAWRLAGGRLGIGSSGYSAAWLAGPFVACYFLLLIQRVWVTAVFDRYMIGVMPFAVLCVVLLYQERVAPRLPSICLPMLVLYALVAVAGTHDWFAWQRARLAAVSELRTAGVPRIAIYGGFEYDGWTQLEEAGSLNDTRIVNPPGTYRSVPLVKKDDPCFYDFYSSVPVIQHEYVVGFDSTSCYTPSTFAPVPYTSWIPPFRRVITVQRIAAEQHR